MTSRQAIVVAGLVFAFGVGGLHLRPLMVWKLQLEPSLSAEPRADRLVVETLREFPAAPETWPRLRAGPLTLRLPLLQDEASACEACRESCVLQFASGTVAVLGERAPATVTEARTNFTPDPQDLSPWRWSWENWRTLDALEARVRSGDSAPDAFRFDNGRSHGVVTVHLSGPQARVLVYAYADDGSPARVLGFTGVDRNDAETVLGTLAVAAGDDPSSASCADL